LMLLAGILCILLIKEREVNKPEDPTSEELKIEEFRSV
jgi:hypothetical protein